MRQLVTLLTMSVVMASCATKPQVVVPKPTIKSIVLVPATTPLTYTVDNRNAAIGLLLPGIAGIAPGIAYAVENRSKSKVLTERLHALEFSPGANFTNAMAEALRKSGYSVQILENVTRTPRDPDNIDYEKLTYAADAVLHLYFSEIGIYSPPATVDYLPRLNASGVIFVKGHPDYLYGETIYYGVDSREGKSWGVSADPKFAYRDFETVLSGIESLKEAFSIGVKEVTQRMAEQIHAALK